MYIYVFLLSLTLGEIILTMITFFDHVHVCKCHVLSTFHSFPKGEDVVVGKKEEEEKSIQEPVSN